MKLFLSACAIALFLEGFAFALFPVFMRDRLRELGEKPANELRLAGVAALLLAAILAVLVSRLF